MSVTIPQSFTEQFSANVHMLSEQRFSYLQMTVMPEEMSGAEAKAVERIGMTQDAANAINERHGDTPLNNTPHSRRWLFVRDYDVADLIDKPDKVRLLIDPNSRYTIRHAGVMGRTKDDVIISALGGSAVEGQGNVLGSATTSVPLPSAQKIASGSVGLTLDKWREAKRRLDAAEVDDFWPRYLGVTSNQLKEMLETEEMTNSDYNAVKALVEGKINSFLGFNVVRCERFLKPSTDRLCYAWAQPAIAFGMPVEPNSINGERPDKRHAQQIYTAMTCGAVRVEDEMVVEIACAE